MDLTARRLAAPIFTLTLLCSAALVFALQPLFARLITPMLGGSPAVWNTAMVFFQAALLVGYGYAHLLARLPSLRTQTVVHAIVLALAFLALPLHVTDVFGAPSSQAPVAWLLGVLAVSVGAPFAAASATAPLLQSWYARTGRADAHDPYYLYAASNLGSLIGLLAYPLVAEPLLTLSTQTLAWTAAYAGVAVLVVLSGAAAAVAGGMGAPQAAGQAAPVVRTRWGERLFWLAAAAAPSSLLLGVTQHISTDVASAPFLWVAPLALYLLTFVVAFAKGGERFVSWALIAHPIALTFLVMAYFAHTEWAALLGASLITFFLSALICHHALAARRPDAARLTEFYLFVSLGGVLGGALTALVAPVVFNGVYEYPLALAAIALFRPNTGAGEFRRLGEVLAAGAVAMVAAMLIRLDYDPEPTALVMGIVGAVAAVAASGLQVLEGFQRGRRWDSLPFFLCALAFAGFMTYLAFNRDAWEIARVVDGVTSRAMEPNVRLLLTLSALVVFGYVAHAAIQPTPTRTAATPVLLGVALSGTLLALLLGVYSFGMTGGSFLQAPLLVCGLALFFNRGRPRMLAALILFAFAVILIDYGRGGRLMLQERSFFGVVRVEDYSLGAPELGSLRVLYHGTTIHGAQMTAPNQERRPLTYYHPQTALGDATLAAIRAHPASRVGLVGLGAGATACLLGPQDSLTIFEIDPQVVRLSTGPGAMFTYVHTCAPGARVELGDARLQLAEEPSGAFDVILVDAFSSDAIPAHLLTREAVALYLDRVGPNGAVILHLSNRNLALVLEAARVARDLNASAAWRLSDRVENDDALGYGGLSASAMVLTQTLEAMAALNLSDDWCAPPTLEGRSWSDDYINLPRALWDNMRGIETAALRVAEAQCIIEEGRGVTMGAEPSPSPAPPAPPAGP